MLHRYLSITPIAWMGLKGQHTQTSTTSQSGLQGKINAMELNLSLTREIAGLVIIQKWRAGSSRICLTEEMSAQQKYPSQGWPPWRDRMQGPAARCAIMVTCMHLRRMQGRRRLQVARRRLWQMAPKASGAEGSGSSTSIMSSLSQSLASTMASARSLELWKHRRGPSFWP